MSLIAQQPVLTGQRATLRPFTRDDLPAMAAILADPEVNRLTGLVVTSAAANSAPSELDDRTTRWYLSRAEQRDRLDLAIVDNGTGECVGEVVLNEWDEANRSCNFRILIGPTGRDRGLGSEATRLMLRYAFAVFDGERHDEILMSALRPEWLARDAELRGQE
jgi:RimJ/RimL family protein N-acetyltransferase